MHYQDERTNGCRVSDAWTYRGLKTVVLENQHLRILVLADKGADIYSFVHKPTDTEFMWRTPWGVRDPRKFVPSTGSPQGMWLDYYEGGWQTVVPHGGYPDTVYDTDMGLHGDVNNMPWDAQVIEDSPERVSVRFRVRGVRMPIFVEKTMTLETESSTLQLSKSVTNEGEQDIDIVWLEHIAIGPPFLSDACRLYLPPCRILTHPETFVSSQKLALGAETDWPYSRSPTGDQLDFRTIPPKSDRSLDMAYFTGQTDGWYALHNESAGVGFAVRYPTEIFRYLWYWRNLGGGWGYPWYGRCYNVGLEPCTSYHNGGLKQAIDNGTAQKIGTGETISAQMTAGAFHGDGTVASIDQQGRVVWA